MNFYIKNILLVFILFWHNSTLAQSEILKIEDVAKVSINYQMRTGYDPVVPISSLEAYQINPNLHHQPTLEIAIEVLELAPSYRIELCKSCYPSEIDGFRQVGYVKKFFTKKGEKQVVAYEYSPSSSGKAHLSVTFMLHHGNNREGNPGGYNTNGQNYNLLGSNTRRRTSIQGGPSVSSLSENMLQRLENQSDTNERLLICQQYKARASNNDRASELGKQLLSKCRLIEIEQDRAWEVVQRDLEYAQYHYEKRRLLQLFLNDYPDHRLARQRLRALENSMNNIIRDSLSNEDINQLSQEQITRVKNTFRITEIETRKNDGNYFYTIVEIHNEEELPVSLIIPNDVTSQSLNNNRYKLRIPKGKDIWVTAQVNGIIFDNKEQNKLLIPSELSTTDSKIKASFIYDEVENKYTIEVKNGQSPYSLQIIGQQGIIEDIKTYPNENFEFMIDEYNFLPSDNYQLKILDKQGNSSVAALQQNVWLGKGKNNSGLYILGLLFVLLGFGGYYWLQQ